MLSSIFVIIFLYLLANFLSYFTLLDNVGRAEAMGKLEGIESTNSTYALSFFTILKIFLKFLLVCRISIL